MHKTEDIINHDRNNESCSYFSSSGIMSGEEMGKNIIISGESFQTINSEIPKGEIVKIANTFSLHNNTLTDMIKKIDSNRKEQSLMSLVNLIIHPSKTYDYTDVFNFVVENPINLIF